MSKYSLNKPFWLNRTIARTEKSLARDQAKLEALKIQQAINEIDHKLKVLASLQKIVKPWINSECSSEATTSLDADGGGQSLQPPSPAGRRLLSRAK